MRPLRATAGGFYQTPMGGRDDGESAQARLEPPIGGLTGRLTPPSARARALTGSAGGRYRPGTVQAHHFFFMDPA
jgi:hypothetical protein